MIRELEIEGVTVFPDKSSFSFVPGINVIVGGNDSGKSHLMKLCYAIAKWCCRETRQNLPNIGTEEKHLRRDLLRVFGTHKLTGLTAYNRGNGQAHLHASLEGKGVPLGSAEVDFSFTSDQEDSQIRIHTIPHQLLQENAIFISPRDVLSLYPCYIYAGKSYPDLLDSASWELCQALEKEPSTINFSPNLRYVMQEIETLLSGNLCRFNGHFYLQRPGQEPLELNLVAEGFKRIGTLGLLIGNGSIRPGTSLFWDEPEMNLNTLHLPLLVRVLLGLCRAGLQVMLTTHSLFLLRELIIQLSDKRNTCITRRFFGLQPPADNSSGVQISAGDSLDQIDPLDSLTAEIEQADRYLNMSYIPNEMLGESTFSK